jgi:hypothetical protein
MWIFFMTTPLGDGSFLHSVDRTELAANVQDRTFLHKA